MDIYPDFDDEWEVENGLRICYKDSYGNEYSYDEAQSLIVELSAELDELNDLEELSADEEERKEALPFDGETVTRDLGVSISAKLLSMFLGYTWKKEFADEDALYLIECATLS